MRQPQFVRSYERPPAKRVLIVEDNELNMRLMNDLLEVQGHRVLKTGFGCEAVKLARATSPDLILMDIQLPDVSGLDVTRWLRHDLRTQAIPIIAVTAFAMTGDAEKALASGCDAYLPKPIALEEFLVKVAAFLSGAAH